MTKSGHTGQNLVGGLRPHEGLRLFVRVGDVGLDRVPELETLGLEDLWDRDAIVLIEWGEKFAPHRSVVAWYCWRVID